MITRCTSQIKRGRFGARNPIRVCTKWLRVIAVSGHTCRITPSSMSRVHLFRVHGRQHIIRKGGGDPWGEDDLSANPEETVVGI